MKQSHQFDSSKASVICFFSNCFIDYIEYLNSFQHKLVSAKADYLAAIIIGCTISHLE